MTLWIASQGVKRKFLEETFASETVFSPVISDGKLPAFWEINDLGMSKDSRPFEPFTDGQSHEAAITLPIKEVVTRLVDMLGLSLVAMLAGVTETRAVNQWMTGRTPQNPQTLRFALQLAMMIKESGDGSIARSWFQGSNPRLHDRSPAFMLRTLPLEEIQGPLATAARSFKTR